MSWKDKAREYCLKCKNNNRLFCTYYGSWEDKRTVNRCEFIQAIDEEKRDKK